ncbi:MAG: AAA family ATPase, partial [Nanoarchaeota archaeon]
SHVYGNTIVIDNIEVARKLGIGRIRMVTLEGDLVEQSGAMIGGFRKRISLNIDNVIRVDSDLRNITNQTQILLPEQSRNLAILKEQDKEVNEFEQEIKKLKELIKEHNSVLGEKEKYEKKFYDEFKDLGGRREKINELLQNREITLVKLEENIRAIEQNINNVSLDRAKFVAGIEGLQKEFEDYKNANIKKTTDLDKLMNEIQKAEQGLLMLGNVNLRALEIYEQIEKEYNELIEKKETLKIEKQDVLNMMQEIESKKKDLFMKTFNEINENFRTIFINLSTKGNAFLELEDKENPFNAGLDIKVKISGNKYLDIRGLSGGEKTLTALAFIFAIQEYQPASFYLLDEVDAALDKNNSEKLSKLVANYSKKAQYIMISHNDNIITEA